jgi:Tfp pilus assembly pilus retraction ATPase PilT
LYKRKVKELDKLIMIDDNLTAIYKNKKIILIANQRKLYMDSNKLKETLADCMSYKKDIEIDGIFLDHKTCARLYTFLDMLT